MDCNPLRGQALELLRRSVGEASARFREGQFEAIEHVLSGRGPLLVVQRTGWGKSNVYFIVTKLLRAAGRGPTLLISPLLALMRNQIAAAERLGVRAARITSEEKNREEWSEVQADLLANRIDLLLISPERLANETFLTEVLYPLAGQIGFLVIDEAHCISDWGHDFRPDYRRITRLVQALPPNLPVLATTATANDRVIADLQGQLGSRLTVQRGSMERRSLCLQTIRLPSPASRLAWLAETLPKLSGSGIIYTLTIRDAQTVAGWLWQHGIEAQAYWGGMDEDREQAGLREQIERELLENRMKVLVATTALGMGFDKPDLAFVIHYQLPMSVIHYYQQVGRAGRALERADAILLAGSEDQEITDYFIESAFPPPEHVEKILDALRASPEGLSISAMQKTLNLTRGDLGKALRLLALESPAPLIRQERTWQATAAPLNPAFWERVERLNKIRRQEQAQMRDYIQTRSCLMQFLTHALDDPESRPCGRCVNCLEEPLWPVSVTAAMTAQAQQFLRRTDHPIEPRQSWPSGAFVTYPFQGRIKEDLRAQPGRVLAIWGDEGWGELVRQGKYQTVRFDERLVEAMAELIQSWRPEPFPAWFTCVPSLNNSRLVSDFTQRLAAKLGLPFRLCVRKAHPTRPQKEMQNSFQQAHNLDGAFIVEAWERMPEPVFLVDDMVDSQWTFTVVSALLRQAGSGPVFPVALAQTSKRAEI